MSMITESSISDDMPCAAVANSVSPPTPPDPTTTSPTQTASSSYVHPDLADFHWHKIGNIGSRKLYWQITIGLLIVCLLGATFIAIGSVYIYDARQCDLNGGSSVPLLLCVVALGMI